MNINPTNTPNHRGPSMLTAGPAVSNKLSLPVLSESFVVVDELVMSSSNSQFFKKLNMFFSLIKLRGVQ